MSKYRKNLPQLGGKAFLSDGGLETAMIYLEGIDLPHFASFTLMHTPEGRDALKRYFVGFAEIARNSGKGLILDTPTWRAGIEWGIKLGLTALDMYRVNHQSVEFLKRFRKEFETFDSPMVVNGVIGPRGDGYDPGRIMSAREAESYHMAQAEALVKAGADMLSAITMTNVSEATGIAMAAKKLATPAVVSFTVETDGRLPTGQSLAEAIAETDAATGNSPAYYMVNCAHPSHFRDKLGKDSTWVKRIRGIRANASPLSHAELDNSTVLHDGNPIELGHDYGEIIAMHPHINVVGGCCGTDHRHVERMAMALNMAA